MYVAIEFSYEYSYIHDTSEQSVANVYGPFETLEEAEKFRLSHKNREDIDCFLLNSSTEA